MRESTYEGSPCKKGHGVLRYKANGTCIVCNADKRKAVVKAKAKINTRYIGTACKKHPELGGERMSSSSTCVQCHKDKSKERQKKNGYPVMARQIAGLFDGIYKAYGHVCSRCQFADKRALTIDHEDQQGSKHVSETGVRYRGQHLYRWLKRNNYPKGFRILCYNCNVIVYRIYTEGLK